MLLSQGEIQAEVVAMLVHPRHGPDLWSDIQSCECDFLATLAGRVESIVVSIIALSRPVPAVQQGAKPLLQRDAVCMLITAARQQIAVLLPFCWQSLSIPAETPAKGRAGVSQAMEPRGRNREILPHAHRSASPCASAGPLVL